MRGIIFVNGILVALASSVALAQTPQRTTATYDDWIVRCEAGGAERTCEMTQSVQLKGQVQPLTQIAIARPAKHGPVKFVFQVPIDVWLAGGVTLTTADGRSEVAAQFSHCVPAGCIAETSVDGKMIEALRGLKENGKLRFKNAAKTDVAVPVSFKGFGNAYDAMEK